MSDQPPAAVLNAVFQKSEDMAKDAQKVEELDFNKIKSPVTADDLLQGMRHMGFQASSIAEAVRIINDMVSQHPPSAAEAICIYSHLVYALLLSTYRMPVLLTAEVV